MSASTGGGEGGGREVPWTSRATFRPRVGREPRKLVIRNGPFPPWPVAPLPKPGEVSRRDFLWISLTRNMRPLPRTFNTSLPFHHPSPSPGVMLSWHGEVTQWPYPHSHGIPWRADRDDDPASSSNRHEDWETTKSGLGKAADDLEGIYVGGGTRATGQTEDPAAGIPGTRARARTGAGKAGS